MKAVSADLGFRMEVIHHGRDLCQGKKVCDYSDGENVVARFVDLGHFKHDPKEFVLGVAVVENEGTDLERVVVPLAVDGSKNVCCRTSRFSAEDGPLYQQRVPVHKNVSGVAATFYTKQPDNNIRLAVFNLFGEIELWELAVTSQNNQFFVVAIRTREFRAYRDNGVFVIPELGEKGKEWLQMERVLVDLFPKSSLFPLSDTYEKKGVDVAGLAPNIGRVLWFSPISGVGAIATRQGEAKAYFGNIMPREGMRFLIPGELVKFDELVVPYGNTGFKWEALGVEPHSI